MICPPCQVRRQYLKHFLIESTSKLKVPDSFWRRSGRLVELARGDCCDELFDTLLQTRDAELLRLFECFMKIC